MFDKNRYTESSLTIFPKIVNCTTAGFVLWLFFLGLIFIGKSLAIDISENTWVRVTPTVSLKSGVNGDFDERTYTKMVYNGLTKKFILWDGFQDDGTYPFTIYSNAIWSYDVITNTLHLEKINNWHNVGGSSYTTVPLPANQTDPTPADRHQYGAMAYVPEKKAIYIWGGANRTLSGGHPTDTWRYNLETNSWEELKPSSHPPVTLEAAMAYDTHSKKIVLFGGDQGGERMTYLYDVLTNVWSEVPQNGPQPPWRMGHAMVYDPVRKVTLLFGGGPWPDGGNDLWAFNISTKLWTQLTPAISPPKRKFHGFAYDNRNDIFLIFGGENGEDGTTYHDTWTYFPNENLWSKLTPIKSPTGSSIWVDMDYDSVENVFVAHFSVPDQYPDPGAWWLYRYKVQDVVAPSPPSGLTIIQQ
jgi:hypothetical protein